MRKLAVVAIAAVVLSMAAMTTWESGRAAVTAEKASAETLKQIEGVAGRRGRDCWQGEHYERNGISGRQEQPG